MALQASGFLEELQEVWGLRTVMGRGESTLQSRLQRRGDRVEDTLVCLGEETGRICYFSHFGELSKAQLEAQVLKPASRLHPPSVQFSCFYIATKVVKMLEDLFLSSCGF